MRIHTPGISSVITPFVRVLLILYSIIQYRFALCRVLRKYDEHIKPAVAVVQNPNMHIFLFFGNLYITTCMVMFVIYIPSSFILTGNFIGSVIHFYGLMAYFMG